MSNNQYVTPIQFSREVGKNSQQIYQWIREGKIPEDCFVQDQITGRKVFIREKIEAWYAARPVRQSSGAVKIASDPSKMLEMMISWFKEAGHEDLANDLGEVLTKMKDEATTAQIAG